MESLAISRRRNRSVRLDLDMLALARRSKPAGTPHRPHIAGGQMETGVPSLTTLGETGFRTSGRVPGADWAFATNGHNVDENSRSTKSNTCRIYYAAASYSPA